MHPLMDTNASHHPFDDIEHFLDMLSLPAIFQRPSITMPATTHHCYQRLLDDSLLSVHQIAPCPEGTEAVFGHCNSSIGQLLSALLNDRRTFVELSVGTGSTTGAISYDNMYTMENHMGSRWPTVVSLHSRAKLIFWGVAGFPTDYACGG